MIRVFLDSSVLIAACGSVNGASHAIIVMAEIGLLKAVISEQVLEECNRNLRKKLPKALPIFEQILLSIDPEVCPDPALGEVEKWVEIIERKDAPILAAAIESNVNRLLTLNTKDFTQEVAIASGLLLQRPSDFIQEVRALITDAL